MNYLKTFGNSAIYIQSEDGGFRQVLEIIGGAVARICWKLAGATRFCSKPILP
jgi:hypothetical protein